MPLGSLNEADGVKTVDPIVVLLPECIVRLGMIMGHFGSGSLLHYQGAEPVKLNTYQSDFSKGILHPIDKYGLRRLACCQIVYRIRPGDDRLLRPAKRLWLLLPSGTLRQRFADGTP